MQNTVVDARKAERDSLQVRQATDIAWHEEVVNG